MGYINLNDRLDPEYALAGALMLDGACYRHIRGKLSHEDVVTILCKGVLTAAEALDAQGKSIDPISVASWLEANGIPSDRETLVELMDITPTTAHVPEYVETILENARRRRIKELAVSIAEDTSASSDVLLGRLSDGTGRLLTQDSAGELMSSSDMMRGFYEHLEARERGSAFAVPTGIELLDKLLGGGLMKGGLYFLAGRPGMGKTAVALNIADNISGGVLFVSLEMAPNQLAARRVARGTGIPARRMLLESGLGEAEYESIALTAAELAERGLYLNRSMNLTVSRIGVLARSVPELSAVVIDYLGLIRPEKSRGSRYEDTSDTTAALKQLARMLDVPVLCLCQLNRASESREGHRPMLSDLRDSGSIEQDADGVMLLFRPDYYDPSPDKRAPSELELEVAKNRHGPTGRIQLAIRLSTANITEAG